MVIIQLILRSKEKGRGICSNEDTQVNNRKTKTGVDSCYKQNIKETGVQGVKAQWVIQVLGNATEGGCQFSRKKPLQMWKVQCY